jgi:hypothetical protein
MADDDTDIPPPTLSPSSGSDGQKAAEQSVSRDVMRAAYNAFKKRWKLTRLDQESQISRGPMSAGQRSTITGITPPDQFPPEVWDELVKQGRLKYAGSGCYAMPP